MKRRAVTFFLPVIFFAWIALADVGASRADPQRIIADVSDRRIAVTAGFTGAKTTLFGALPEEGDVIVVVTGPRHTVTVRRKERVLGLWLNRSSASFRDVPGFYWVASSRPLADIASASFLQTKRIGADNLRFASDRLAGTARAEEFAQALMTLRSLKGEMVNRVSPVTIMGQRLYRADLSLPDSAPTGLYVVTTYLLRNKSLIDQQDIALTLRKEGSTAAFSGLALRYPVLYACLAILLALFSGWASAWLMRGR